ncbi:lytic transglycosylase domain-containing protein [Taklimakanibacter deserti]|uniref:lytic transglycosylase domain-containing protein n=1 Tax=Taklimakanibacter deserti TaxID=2267839 RepID=UPI000E650620
MTAIHALLLAALLAGTVLSGPAEARGTADPSAHAWRAISKQDYFTVMNAKKLGKIKKVGILKAHKKAAAAGKATKKILKKVGLTPRKKLAKLAVADKKPETASVVVSKRGEIKPHKIARLELASVVVSKQDEIEPHEIALLEPTSVVVSKQDETEPHEPHEPHDIALLEPASAVVSKRDETEPHEIARLEPASMSKVLRSGPREVKDDILGEALPIREADEVRIAEIIREIAPSYGVPIWFALRIAEVESGYNPYALGRAGEIGVYQLKCQTARGMGFEGDCSNLTDARTNVSWGLKHLSLAIALSGGNLRLAASKHNAGLGRKSLVHSYIAKVF